MPKEAQRWFDKKYTSEVKKKVIKININNNINGSLKIEGDFEIVDKNGNVYDLGGRTAISICRCGLSQNKPFCDSSGL